MLNVVPAIALLLAGCASERVVVADTAVVADQYVQYRPAVPDPTPGAGGRGGAGAGAVVR
jgi:hypothetical protein